MTAVILDLLSPFLPYIAAAMGAVALFLTGRASGRAKASQRQAEATVKGIQRGAEGAADAAADIKAGKTPQEVKNANDAAWR